MRRIEAIGERRGTAAQCAVAYCALRAFAFYPRNLRANRRNPYYIGVTAEPEGTFILLTKTPTDTSAAAPQQITSGPPELETGGVLFIDLNAIVFNWRSLMQRAVPADCAAVVKADAYGCGIEPVSAELAKGGCRTFFVAHLAERLPASSSHGGVGIRLGKLDQTSPRRVGQIRTLVAQRHVRSQAGRSLLEHRETVLVLQRSEVHRRLFGIQGPNIEWLA